MVIYTDREHDEHLVICDECRSPILLRIPIRIEDDVRLGDSDYAQRAGAIHAYSHLGTYSGN